MRNSVRPGTGNLQRILVGRGNAIGRLLRGWGTAGARRLAAAIGDAMTSPCARTGCLTWSLPPLPGRGNVAHGMGAGPDVRGGPGPRLPCPGGATRRKGSLRRRTEGRLEGPADLVG